MELRLGMVVCRGLPPLDRQRAKRVAQVGTQLAQPIGKVG